MRKLLWLIVCLMTMWCITSCSTKEEKGAKLIKNELFKTLYDFDSYQPIETKVTEAKANIYNDSAFWNKGEELRDTIILLHSYVEKAKHALDMADIFEPSYFSSASSIKNFKKYLKEAKTYNNRAKELIDVCRNTATEMLVDAQKIDTTTVIGYEIIHSFRCKTKGGNSDIAHYRYIVSKDFKSIFLQENMNDETEDLSTRNVLEKIKEISNGDF